MGPEVSDGWTNLLELELKDPLHIIGEERAEGPFKTDGERAKGLSYKIVEEHVAGLSRRKEVKSEWRDSQSL